MEKLQPMLRENYTKPKTKKTLTSKGKSQIKKAAKRLLKYKPTIIFSSEELRATKSADIISKVCGIKVKAITGLQERNWGNFSGKSFSEIADQVLNKLTVEERYTYIPPNGESWKSFDTRLRKTINNLINKHKGETVIIVTHEGAIRALLPYLLNIPKEESFKFDPANASLTIFEHQNGKLKKVMLDNTTHL